MFTAKHYARRTGLVLVAGLLLFGGAGTFLYQRSAAAEKFQMLATNPEASSLPWPGYGQAALGAIGYGVLESHGDQTPKPTASVAKVMTALAVLNKKPLEAGQQGPVITITQKDVDLYNYYRERDGSLAAVRVGEKITELEALEALLLPSSNNMADTLANWAFGSVKEYSDYANELAKSLGMTQSDFADASGYSPKTVSTARDLIKLGEAALQHPVIARIVSQKTAKIPVAGVIKNTNYLLGKHNINGVKTGNTDQAGGVFMGSRPVMLPGGKTVQLISVVMGAPDVKTALDDSVPILDMAAQNLTAAALDTAKLTTQKKQGGSE